MPAILPGGAGRFRWQEALGLWRNHYDRIVRFSFGLLMAYRLREWLLWVTRLRHASLRVIPERRGAAISRYRSA